MTRYLLLTSFALTIIGCASAAPAPASPAPAPGNRETSKVEDGKTCADMSCAPGTHCEMAHETPSCVADQAPAQAECKPGEQQVESSTACLQDDAVCYQLGDGRWCTGPSGKHGNW